MGFLIRVSCELYAGGTGGNSALLDGTDSFIFGDFTSSDRGLAVGADTIHLSEDAGEEVYDDHAIELADLGNTTLSAEDFVFI